MPDQELTSREIALLEFEGRWHGRPASGTKEAAIRAAFQIKPARYYQLLFALVERPEAVRHDPQLVHRIIRLRDQRTAARADRRPAA